MPIACDDVGASTPAVDEELTAILDAIPVLAGPRRIKRLPGGLTNHNYQVTKGRRRYVARLSSASSELLAIDRDAEYSNSLIAATVGAGPGVVEYVPSGGLLVIDWVDGRTLGSADLANDGVLSRVIAAVGRLHAAPRFADDFDMFAVQRRYLALVQEHGFRLPARYLDFMPLVAQIEAALAVHVQPMVPCHNDLLASNLIDDGTRVWIIDYEYAGNNDPYFELGNMWSEASLPIGRLDDIVGLYHGSPEPSLVARARLYGLMSKYGWTLWASIQDAISDIEFDFWSWGMEKYDRATAEFDGPDLARLLADVTS